MKNKEIVEILRRFGTLLDIKGEIVFKVRAYFKAADTIESLTEDIEVVKNENRLSQLPGIGKELERKIIEYLETGKMSSYEKLIHEIPESLLDIVSIPSVGPKKAKLFYNELKIKNIDELLHAAKSGKLLNLPGIKEKTLQNIIQGIEIVKQGHERMDLGMATEIAESIIDALKKFPEIKQISVAGSLRRMKETIRDVDILIDSTNPAKVMQAFVTLPQAHRILVKGDTKSSILTSQNIQVDLRVVESKSYGAALLYFTGSKNFNIKLRQEAIKKDMKVNEYGIFSVKGKEEKRLAGKSEEDCFKALGYSYIPPELREDIGMERFFRGEKIPPLVDLKDIKGDLHVHSTWSDGQNTIEEMGKAAERKGYEYVAISDHSARLKIARGISLDDLKKKREEINKLNKKLKDFRILFSTEVEIDSDGNLDYNDKILSEFDIVTAAIHLGLEQEEERLTRRLVKACKNKYVHIIAHPFGGLIGRRKPYDIDFKELCKAAVDTNTFLEINAFPTRLDLNTTNIYFAHQFGVKFAISTDSHSTRHLDYMKLGVALAKRAWLTEMDLINSLPLAKLLRVLK